MRFKNINSLVRLGRRSASNVHETLLCMTKFVIIVLMIFMVTALGLGLYCLLKTPEEGDTGSNLAWALTWRIGSWGRVICFRVDFHKGGLDHAKCVGSPR